MIWAYGRREAALGVRVEVGARSCYTPRPGLGFPKSAFGHHWPPQAHRGRLGIRVARSIELSWRSGC